MPREERKKGKHLTWDDRYEIQKGLKEHRTFKEIAYLIGCSPDTVSKEIRRHRYRKVRNRDGIHHTIPNRCKYRSSCRRWDVCNNCPKSISCLFDKYLYNADYAHKEYCEKLRESRQGIDMTRDELAALDSLVSPLIRKGQPLSHILAHHAEEIPCGERTLYKYIGAGYLTARNLDMRRTVRYRKRVRTAPVLKISYRKKEGHHYCDYLDYIAQNDGVRVVQMDTVEGSKGGKLLHTLLWPENNLMLAFLINTKEMKNTVATFDWLEETLGSEMFRELFPVILTTTDVNLRIRNCLKKEKTGKHGPDCFIVRQSILSKRENWKRIMST